MRVERLRKKNDFENVFRKGQKFFSPYASVFFIAGPASVLRAGILVGKKITKSAVARNRLRRRLREALRSIAKDRKKGGGDIVIAPKPTLLPLPFQDLKKELTRILTHVFHAV